MLLNPPTPVLSTATRRKSASRSSSRADHAAMLSILVSEARRLDLQRAHSLGLSQQEIDAKWKMVGREAVSAILKGDSPEVARAQLARRFPFLGLVDPQVISAVQNKRLATIERSRAEGDLFITANDPYWYERIPSPKSDAEEGSSNGDEATASSEGADESPQPESMSQGELEDDWEKIDTDHLWTSPSDAFSDCLLPIVGGGEDDAWDLCDSKLQDAFGLLPLELVDILED